MSSESASSSNKPGCFGKVIALLTALGGGAGIVALITFFQDSHKTPSTSVSVPQVNLNVPQPNSDKNDSNPPVTEPPQPPDPTVDSNINWGNISKYFEIKNFKFEKGFQQADSELSFIVKAKGNFSGKLYVYFYDSEGVKICPSIVGDCSLLGYEGFAAFSMKENNIDSVFWQTNEADRVMISVPNNATTIKFNFNQSTF